MCDLIKKEDVLKIIDNKIQRTCDCLQLDTQIDIRFAVEGLPTVEPVRGKWIAQDDGLTKFMCSKCKSKNHQGYENFCPNCGADMRKKENKCKQV